MNISEIDLEHSRFVGAIRGRLCVQEVCDGWNTFDVSCEIYHQISRGVVLALWDETEIIEL